MDIQKKKEATWNYKEFALGFLVSFLIYGILFFLCYTFQYKDSLIEHALSYIIIAMGRAGIFFGVIGGIGIFILRKKNRKYAYLGVLAFMVLSFAMIPVVLFLLLSGLLI